jgi:hypothetical protein
MENDKLVITEKCEIEIPKAGMVISFDGEKCLIGFVANTDLVVDGDLRIATQGNFEVVSEGHQVLSTISEDKKIMLGTVEKNYEKLQEIEDGNDASIE